MCVEEKKHVSSSFRHDEDGLVKREAAVLSLAPVAMPGEEPDALFERIREKVMKYKV